MTKLGSFDFQKIEKYRDNLKAMEKAVPGLVEECVYELAKKLLDKTLARTPTNMGELRRGWKIGKVSMTSKGAKVEVFNVMKNSSVMEDGQRLANGQDWEEGKFIMTISVQKLERQLPNILEKKMKRFVKSFLK
ncbi:MAG TPA: HK97 gp10 family phage protein [Candidatus Paenibacillus intestinavium]|nr:HK97 gp10 family phage protein [Candidatus Paenibacillus intestinavium]